jgi:hypothetical protein
MMDTANPERKIRTSNKLQLPAGKTVKAISNEKRKSRNKLIFLASISENDLPKLNPNSWQQITSEGASK